MKDVGRWLLGDLVGLDFLEELLGLGVILKVVPHWLQDLVKAFGQGRFQVTCRSGGA